MSNSTHPLNTASTAAGTAEKPPSKPGADLPDWTKKYLLAKAKANHGAASTAEASKDKKVKKKFMNVQFYEPESDELCESSPIEAHILKRFSIRAKEVLKKDPSATKLVLTKEKGDGMSTEAMVFLLQKFEEWSHVKDPDTPKGLDASDHSNFSSILLVHTAAMALKVPRLFNNLHPTIMRYMEDRNMARLPTSRVGAQQENDSVAGNSSQGLQVHQAESSKLQQGRVFNKKSCENNEERAKAPYAMNGSAGTTKYGPKETKNDGRGSQLKGGHVVDDPRKMSYAMALKFGTKSADAFPPLK